MTDTDRKLLTEWLGECWHEDEEITEYPYYDIEGFKHWTLHKGDRDIREGVTRVIKAKNNRTFTTPNDFFACFNRLVEVKEYHKFMKYIMYEVDSPKNADDAKDIFEVVMLFTAWLLSTTDAGTYQLCELIAEWLRREK